METKEKIPIPRKINVKLSQEGYSNKFIDEDKLRIDVEGFECVVCLLVAREPVQTPCGHSACKTCWEDWTASCVGEIRCPVDNDVIDVSRVFDDRKDDRAILSLRVFCDNIDFGCDQVLELRNLPEHLEKCPYKTESCPLLCGDCMLLWSVKGHTKENCGRRLLTCESCQGELMAQDLQEHEDKCLMGKVACEFCETEVMPRNELSDHQKTTCLKFPTYCTFALIGCHEKVEREALESHHKNEMQKHLSLLYSAVLQFYDTVGTNSPRQRGTHEDGGTYELPASLWAKVPRTGTDTDIAWRELPGCVGAVTETCQASVCDQIKRLEKAERGIRKELVELRVDNNDLKNKFTQSIIANETVLNELTEKFQKQLKETEQRLTDVNEVMIHRLGYEPILFCPFVWEYDPKTEKISSIFFTGNKGYYMNLEINDENNTLCFKVHVGIYDDTLAWPCASMRVKTQYMAASSTGGFEPDMQYIRLAELRILDRPTDTVPRSWSCQLNDLALNSTDRIRFRVTTVPTGT